MHWVSPDWFTVVGSGDLRRFRAGTCVERLRTMKGAFAYAAKRYAAKAVDVEFDGKPGRYWGVVGRDNLPLGKREVVELNSGQAVRVRRVGLSSCAHSAGQTLVAAPGRCVCSGQLHGEAALHCGVLAGVPVSAARLRVARDFVGSGREEGRSASGCRNACRSLQAWPGGCGPMARRASASPALP